MNFQQLEYIIAVDTHRHFARAAESCFVTQATLSMMVKKLEQELGVTLFDRSRQPVVPTEIGAKIIAQAKRVVQEGRRLHEIVAVEQDELRGELRVGIIPTLAPYLLPLFMHDFLKKHPNVQLKVNELTTDEIVRKLLHHDLDAGLLAIPLNHPELVEQSLFHEAFVVYAVGEVNMMKKEYVLAQDIDVNRLWLLEEGHCLRSQVINLCALKEREKAAHQLDFATGSLETLKKIVQINQGITILPALALRDLDAKEHHYIRFFAEPAPGREIGLITYRYLVKENLIKALFEEILLHLPPGMGTTEEKKARSVVATARPY